MERATKGGGQPAWSSLGKKDVYRKDEFIDIDYTQGFKYKYQLTQFKIYVI